MNKDILPKVKGHYIDINLRSLWVGKIDIGSSLGREVQGSITAKDLSGKVSHKDYSCTLKMWEEIWRDRVPRTDPNQMKIG